MAKNHLVLFWFMKIDSSDSGSTWASTRALSSSCLMYSFVPEIGHIEATHGITLFLLHCTNIIVSISMISWRYCEQKIVDEHSSNIHVVLSLMNNQHNVNNNRSPPFAGWHISSLPDFFCLRDVLLLYWLINVLLTHFQMSSLLADKCPPYSLPDVLFTGW